jgi:spore coat polysaccharide biosynthesis protein SpsF
MRPVWAVVTARMSSTRKPGKSMAMLAGRPSLAHIIARLKQVPGIDGVVVATSERDDDERIRRCALANGARLHAGSLDDVLGRVADAVRGVDAETVVLITGDCPMIDPAVVERVVDAYRRERPDYASSVLTQVLTYPAGHSCEVFAAEALLSIEASTRDPVDREHVTTHFYRNPDRYTLLSVEAEGDEVRPDLWLSLDTEDDYRGISAIFDELHDDSPVFGYREVLELLADRPDLTELNRAHDRR